MDWLKEILGQNIQDEKTVDGIIENVNKTLPQHFIPKSKYNSASEELKTTRDEMDKLKNQVSELSKSASGNEELQKKLQETSLAFDTFKQETEKREKVREKTGVLEKALRTSGAAEDAVDLLLKEFNVDELSIDSKGAIVDWDLKLKDVKEKRKSLFATVKHETGKPPKGDSGNADVEMDKMRKAMGLL